MSILDQYSTSKIRHPSWRVYKAIADIKDRLPNKKDILDEVTPTAFGLKEGIDVYFPAQINDPLTEELFIALTTDNFEDDLFNIKDCLSLFMDIKGRQLLEGTLMLGASPIDAANELGYATEVVQTYSQLFFDVTVWRTDADRCNYMSNGICGKDAIIKRQLDEQGLEFVKAKVFNVRSRLKIDKAIVHIFALLYQQTVKYIKLDTPEDQKTAQEWAKLTLGAFKELKNAKQAEGGIRELTIALQASPASKISIEDLNDGKSTPS